MTDIRDTSLAGGIIAAAGIPSWDAAAQIAPAEIQAHAVRHGPGVRLRLARERAGLTHQGG